jgi:DNA polymerase-3 subunit epsilon
VISTETTGMNPEKDVILSINAFMVNDSIFIGDSFEVILLQYKYLHDNRLSNEFIIESKMNKLETDAIKSLLNLSNSILVDTMSILM